MVERAVLAAVSAGCLVAAWMWGRSSRRLQRAMRRIEQASGAGADAAALARAAFNKETHTALLYAVLAIGATLILVLGRSLYYIPFLLVFAPIGVSFRYASRFLAAARLAEERSVIERRAEEVLAQEQLAPMRWSARLAPEQLPEIDGFEVGTLYEPGTGAMAGDFYDLYPSGRGRLAAVIGDVSGHGIDPSITAFQVKYLLRVFLRQYRDPAQAMEELNAVMSSQPHTEELVSLCAVVFDQSAGTLRYASAGHPPAWHWHDGAVRPLRATGPLLTLAPSATYTSREVGLDPGDVLLLYTDGLAEARAGENLFGEERVASILRRDPGLDVSILCKTLRDAALEFADQPFGDDIAILAVRRT
ncbi:MAG TPA: PP2C family protein-serine/threonine phosphatase [Acidimicrobiales bacterium]|nr:PP2C family protein-serine/threonine phosphatase [Acidimicrobiales bacterium]